jgi:hypothetical protein
MKVDLLEKVYSKEYLGFIYMAGLEKVFSGRAKTNGYKPCLVFTERAKISFQK